MASISMNEEYVNIDIDSGKLSRSSDRDTFHWLGDYKFSRLYPFVSIIYTCVCMCGACVCVFYLMLAIRCGFIRSIWSIFSRECYAVAFKLKVNGLYNIIRSTLCDAFSLRNFLPVFRCLTAVQQSLNILPLCMREFIDWQMFCAKWIELNTTSSCSI